jgi:primosomal protein N' (replication factor Y) (superfamily II helicase)
MLVDVALPLPVPRTFTYQLEGSPVAPGSRVLVPFGRRRLIGWVTGRPANPQVGNVRDVLRVLDGDGTRVPELPPELLDLCEWVADYYLAPLGQVLRVALPLALGDPRRPQPRPATRRLLRITRELPSLLERDRLFGRARRQLECYEMLESATGAVEVSHLMDQGEFSRSVLDGLVAKGLAAYVEQEFERDPFAEIPAPEPVALSPTPAQHAAIGALVAASREMAANGGRSGNTLDRRPFLLRGVTGSGKTLVYIELLREVVLRQGRGAIVLVPEIALTPQTVARFRAHFGDAVAVLHSGLSDGERLDAWRALRCGDRRVAVGARSAVFAPVPSLGAVIVDEEHESSYKQGEAPRYHAREVAIVRAQRANAVCLLGSATPSLESWTNAGAGKFRLLEMPERVEGRPLPPVMVVDLREERRRRRDVPAGPKTPGSHDAARSTQAAAAGPVIVSSRLQQAMAERLERDEQTILLLNRRGYSAFVQCWGCGRVWHCPRCNVSLTFHRLRRRLVCHYCSHHEPPPTQCPDCTSSDLAFRGIGTEQVERSVGELFPTARLARMDVDTTSGKWSHHHILGRVGRGEVDILLGTQMIAKGLDFPGVTLVGVINADVGMNLPDFRAAERTFQLLTQVAGRAGRGPRGGEVIIQSAMPGHYAVTHAVAHDYPGFAARELDERRQPTYPPHCRLLNIVTSGTDEGAVATAAEEAATWVSRRLRRTRGDIELLGPAPCAIDRIRHRWRWHFLLRSRRAGPLGAVGRLFHERHPQRIAAGDIRFALDRDPVALL